MLLVVAVSLLSGSLVLLVPCEGLVGRLTLYVGALLTQWITLFHAGALNWLTFLVVWAVSAVGFIGFAFLTQWMETKLPKSKQPEKHNKHVRY